MNKKLLIALGILIVLIVGLLLLNYFPAEANERQVVIERQVLGTIGSEPMKYGENSVTITSIKAVYIGYYPGLVRPYKVRLYGYCSLTASEHSGYRVGFEMAQSGYSSQKWFVTTVAPGVARYYSDDVYVKCATAYWWRAYGMRQIAPQVEVYGATKSWGVNDIPCQ